MRILYAFYLLLFVLSVSAQATSNTVTGSIKDMDSGKLLPGAEVTIDFNWQTYSAITDSAGTFTIKTNVQVADGNFPIQVKLAGYYELNGFIFVKERSNFNFSMKKMPVPVVKDTIPEISFEGLATNNWVFLLDISASMNTPEKLPLIREGLKSIVDLFRNEDRVAIVTFSGSAKEILPSTNGMNKDKIIQAIDNIQPGGKSEGATAVNAAYDVAIKNFIPGGNNRIIIATDGLFTSGDKDLKAIKKILKKHLAKDIRCSVFLVGKPGAMVKNELQQIADTGQGNLVQIADEQEARQKMFEEAKNNH